MRKAVLVNFLITIKNILIGVICRITGCFCLVVSRDKTMPHAVCIGPHDNGWWAKANKKVLFICGFR